MDPDSQSPHPSELPPAGWYPDPSGRVGFFRWWDGRSWSQHVSDAVAFPAVPADQIAINGHVFVLAGWWRRAGGLVLDQLVVLVPTLLLQMVISESAYSKLDAFGFPGGNPSASPAARVLVNLLVLAIGLSYQVWFIASRGQTVGMMISGIKTVDQHGGVRLTTGQAWRRALAVFVLLQVSTEASFFSGLGHQNTSHLDPAQGVFVVVAFAGALLTFMWPLGNSLNQTLQDKFARSVVVINRSVAPRMHEAIPSTPAP